MPSHDSVLQDHFLRPRNQHLLDTPNAVGFADMGGSPPRILVALNISDELLVATSFSAIGCGYLIACGSACTQLATGREIEFVLQLCPEDVDRYLGGLPVHRKYCAELAMRAMHDAINRRRT